MFKSRDYEAFAQGGAGGDYAIEGDYNLFMQCEAPDETAF
jgi:hypothetical protein